MYDGKRDFLSVSTWLHQNFQHMSLIQLNNPTYINIDENNVSFVGSYISENAEIWWFTLTHSGNVPESWEEFKKAIMNKFIQKYYL